MIDQLHSKFTLCEKRTRLYEQILLVTKNEETMTISPYSVCVCVCLHVCVCVCVCVFGYQTHLFQCKEEFLFPPFSYYSDVFPVG